MRSRSSRRTVDGPLSALAYFSASFFIVVGNKWLFTHYQFPGRQTLLCVQFALSAIVLHYLSTRGWIKRIPYSTTLAHKLLPFALCTGFNAAFGMGALNFLSIPMFSVLRRLTTVSVIFMQWYWYGKTVSQGIACSVFTMLLGAVIAAARDLSFNLIGYVLILTNDLLTAAQLVFVAGSKDELGVDQFALQFYNCVLAGPFLAMLIPWVDDVAGMASYPLWGDIGFLLAFILSCCLGFVLTASTFWCTQTNSALTTSVVGQVKNVLTTLAGVVLFPDYAYDPVNVVGLIVGLVGSLIYSYIKMSESKKPGQYVSFVDTSRRRAGRVLSL